MTVTFSNPVRFMQKTNVGMIGCNIDYYKTKLSSGLELVAEEVSLVGFSSLHKQFVRRIFLFEDKPNQTGSYDISFGDPNGYQVNVNENVITVLTSIGYQLETIAIYPWAWPGATYNWPVEKDPPTQRSKIVAKIQTCSCGFTTQYELECDGVYVCRQCQYQKDCFGNNK